MMFEIVPTWSTHPYCIRSYHETSDEQYSQCLLLQLCWATLEHTTVDLLMPKTSACISSSWRTVKWLRQTDNFWCLNEELKKGKLKWWCWPLTTMVKTTGTGMSSFWRAGRAGRDDHTWPIFRDCMGKAMEWPELPAIINTTLSKYWTIHCISAP